MRAISISISAPTFVPGEILAALHPSFDLALTSTGPLHWPGSLMPFQLDGIRSLLSHDRLLLADEMGLGKTIQVLAFLRLLFLRELIQRALVVVPASVFGQWLKQFRRWAPELRVVGVRGLVSDRLAQWRSPAHVDVVSYETLRNDSDSASSIGWDVVVADEAQRFKNRDAQLAAVVKALPRARAWALTGTPLENRLDDLASVLEFVTPLQHGARPAVMRPDRALRASLDKLQLRRRKRDVLQQLPPKTECEVLLTLGRHQREAYDRALHDGVVELERIRTPITVVNVLELILRLKQLCNFEPISGDSAKADDLEERIDQLSASGEKALIFSQFTDERFGVAAIRKRLSRFEPLVYTGAMSLAERNGVVREFERRGQLMIVSLRAGGTGLDIQSASYVFHFDRWWNPAVENQASDRSHRIGQTRSVHIYTYSIEDTIEQRIIEILREKRILFDEVVGGAGISVQSALTDRELFALVGLDRP